jgi:phosphoribosylamine--glycine ligase
VRVLGIGDSMDLGALYLELQRAGHQVRVFVGDEAARDTFSGLVERTADWRPELAWVKAAGREGFVVFETASHGALGDGLRAQGFNVIGGNSYGDRLEGDRAFGQQTMREVGMRVVPTHEFDDFDRATAFVAENRGRYVYKPSGAGLASGRTFVGELEDGADLIAYLTLQRRSWPADVPVRLVLMARLDGVEVGVGGYFDGQRFLQPTCLDWEHKRFFPGDLGEMTGEMGTVVTYRNGERLFRETLGRMTGRLAAAGYRGYINVNTIVDEAGVHPLEFTCRFGYPGFAILRSLQGCGWEALFREITGQSRAGTFETRGGYAVGVVMTVPPFPYAAGYQQLSKGLPVILRPALTDADRAHVHLAEVAMQDGQLVTSGVVGYVLVVTGCGDTVEGAREAAYRRVGQICIPNARYRGDIGERFLRTDEARLRGWGWL